MITEELLRAWDKFELGDPVPPILNYSKVADEIALLRARAQHAEARVVELEADYLRRHNDAIDYFEKWKIAEARATELQEQLYEKAILTQLNAGDLND